MTRRIVQGVGVLLVVGLLVTYLSNTVSARRSRAKPRQVAGPAFVFPTDGTAYPVTGPYIFKVKPIRQALGYVWSFVQGDVIVYQNLAWEGRLSSSSYIVSLGSKAHQLIHAGDLRVGVRAMLAGGRWSATGEVSVRIQQGRLRRSPAPRLAQGRTSIQGAVAGCHLQQVAFCDTFDAPAGTGNRSGDLNGLFWGVSRINQDNNSTGGLYDGWFPTTRTSCGTQTVLPPRDIVVCNGQLVEAVTDGDLVSILAMYPTQPFDIAGRTGTAVFDVSADSEGSHAAWPSFVYSDQPVPAASSSHAAGRTYAANSFGFSLDKLPSNCPLPNQTGVDQVFATSNYAYRDLPLTEVNNCVTHVPGELNHFEVRISQSRVEIWGTNAGSTTLQELGYIANAGLTLTRGVIWMEDIHYNANKFNDQGTHTFTWDNVGFDGPTLPRDLHLDVNDAMTPHADGTVNLGWYAPDPSGGTPLTLQVPGATDLGQASGALVTLNFFPTDTSSLLYRVNGNAWHTLAWPYPDTTTYAWRTIALPVALSELHAGTNTLDLEATKGGTAVANVDVILLGAQGVKAS